MWEKKQMQVLYSPQRNTKEDNINKADEQIIET